MATDNSPPRIRLILTLAAGTVVTLVLLEMVFKSYFQHYVDETVAMRVAEHPPVELKAARELEQKDLTGSPIPIDMAMHQLATRARESSIISPEPSDDMGPMAGWSKLPRQVPSQAAQANLATAHAGVGTASEDGGVAAASGDGGVAALATGDASAAAAIGDAGARTTAAGDSAVPTKPNAPPAGGDKRSPTPGH